LLLSCWVESSNFGRAEASAEKMVLVAPRHLAWLKQQAESQFVDEPN